MTLENWWGIDAVAHFYPNLNATRGTKAHRDHAVTSCGLRMTGKIGGATRFDPDTGQPWPRCEKCKAATHTKREAQGEKS